MGLYPGTYVHAAPRGAARDVIKWAWLKFSARSARSILQPPLCQNPAYATDNGSITAANSSFETLVSTTDSALSILRKICTYIMVPDSYIH